MELRAYLINKPDKDGLCRIAIAFNNKGKHWIKTNVKALPASWDQEGQYVKATQPLHKKLNTNLIERKLAIKNAIEALTKKGIDPTTETVTEELKHKPAVVHVQSGGLVLSSLLFDFVKKNTGRLKKGYLRKYLTIGRSLDDYKPGLLADDFTHDEVNLYVNDYLLDVCEVENNTIHDYIRRIVYIMKRNIKRINNDDFLDFNFKYVKPKPFWLDWSDIEKLESYEPLEKVDIIYRDEFLFRCYTGLRWSDANQLRPEHFIKKDGNVFFDFHVIKTSASQNIQMIPKAVAILEKWRYKMPKLYASDCNEKIKVIARGAKINDMVEDIQFKGSERIVSLVPKWKLVTTHVARRTFARRWMDLKGDIGKLSKYLGHSSISQTSDYVGYTTKEVNDELGRLMG